MAIVHEFKYFKPKKLKEAVSLLAEHKHSVVLAGGTDLVPNLKDGTRTPSAVVDIKGIATLAGLDFRGKMLRIGALATFSDLIASEIVRKRFPLILEMAKTVASTAIRNRATAVGNICSAVPCTDCGPVLCVYDAIIHVAGTGCNLRYPVSTWFKGPRQTAIKGPEIVTSVAVPQPAVEYGGCFIKLGRYKGEDLAQASVTVLALPRNQYRVAFGSVAPVPLRAKKIEALLKGKSLDESLINAAVKLISEEIAPITDVRASKEYRLYMCEVMFRRAIETAVQRLHGGGPTYGTVLI